MEKNLTPILVVAAALQDGNGRILMHRRPEGKAHAGQWEFPGGKVEAGETPQQALAREIAEETGLSLDPGDCREAAFAAEAQDRDRPPIVIILYTARHWHGEVEAMEGGTLTWFEPSAIGALDKPPLDVALAARLLEFIA